MRFVFDTNIVLFYLKDGKTKDYIERKFAPFSPPNRVIVSFVTIAEIKALALKNSWGPRRIAAVEQLLSYMAVVDVAYPQLLDNYARIDAYSQCRINGYQYQFTARNMGKNDLWVAATTGLSGATLLTGDKDFEHLAPEYFPVEYIDHRKIEQEG